MNIDIKKPGVGDIVLYNLVGKGWVPLLIREIEEDLHVNGWVFGENGIYCQYGIPKGKNMGEWDLK